MKTIYNDKLKTLSAPGISSVSFNEKSKAGCKDAIPAVSILELLLCIVIAVLILANSVASAQTPGIGYAKCYGTGSFEIFNSVSTTSDGGLVTGGTKAGNFWLQKVNKGGGVTLDVNFGGTNTDECKSVRQTSDGGYILAGKTLSNNGSVTGFHGTPCVGCAPSNEDAWIVKTNSSGVIQWQRTYGGSNFEEFLDVRQTSDGGYITVGWILSNSGVADGDITGFHGLSDVIVVKYDDAGTKIWSKTLGGSGIDIGKRIVQATDGGFIFVGDVTSNNGDVSGLHGTNFPPADVWVVKLSATGTIVWQKCLGGSAVEFGEGICLTADGGVAIAGTAASTNGDVTGNHGDRDMWLVKLTASGAISWQKSLGGTYRDEGKDVAELPNGNFVITGKTASNDGNVTGFKGTVNNTATSDIWIVKTDNSGALLWNYCYGGTGLDVPVGIIKDGSCGFSIAGQTNTPNNGNVSGMQGMTDGWLLKFVESATCSTIPTLLSAAVTNGKVTLTWKMSGCNVGANVYYRKSGIATWSSVSVTSNSAVLLNLDPLSTYEWKVRTKCASSPLLYSSFSSSSSFTTGILRQGDPSELSATAGSKTEAVIFPNPASSEIRVSLNSEEQVFIIQLLNIDGKVLLEKEIINDEGMYEESFGISHLNNGLYLIRISSENTSVTKRFIKN